VQISNAQLENGTNSNQPGLLTVPQNVQDGYIQAVYPPFKVQNGDRFRALIGCQYNAPNCYVSFTVNYQIGNGPIVRIFGPFGERYEVPGRNGTVDVNLSSLAGQDVKFILRVSAQGTPNGDLAMWIGPYIYRVGATGASSAPQAAGTPVPTTAVPGAQSTPTTPAAAATGTPSTPGTAASPSASTYQNAKYNFKFSLPAGAVVVSQADNLGRVSLPLAASGTNLQEKYILVTAAEGKNPCVTTDMAGGTAIESVTINGNTFSKQAGEEGAAGSQYDWTSFATTRNNACILITFVLRSTNPENYPTPPAPYDTAAESAVIDTVMNTFGAAQ
jgi:hypothetical protein